jgi:hypothetical protein
VIQFRFSIRSLIAITVFVAIVGLIFSFHLAVERDFLALKNSVLGLQKGTPRELLIEGVFKRPPSLPVDTDSLYWQDQWRIGIRHTISVVYGRSDGKYTFQFAVIDDDVVDGHY